MDRIPDFNLHHERELRIIAESEGRPVPNNKWRVALLKAGLIAHSSDPRCYHITPKGARISPGAWKARMMVITRRAFKAT